MARWALIAEEDSDRRSTCALALTAALRRAGVRVGGFVQRRVRDAMDRKGHEILRLARDERIALSTGGIVVRAGQEGFCDYAFSIDAFARAARWIEEDAPGSDVLVLDAISRMEAQGKGHAAALRLALAREEAVVVICARASQTFALVEALALDPEEAVGQIEGAGDEARERAFTGAMAAAARTRR